MGVLVILIVIKIVVVLHLAGIAESTAVNAYVAGTGAAATMVFNFDDFAAFSAATPMGGLVRDPDVISVYRLAVWTGGVASEADLDTAAEIGGRMKIEGFAAVRADKPM